jgi:hypothetical protein
MESARAALPFDVARCIGVASDDGDLAIPCDRCARALHAHPLGAQTPWLREPPRRGLHCEALRPLPLPPDDRL